MRDVFEKEVAGNKSTQRQWQEMQKIPELSQNRALFFLYKNRNFEETFFFSTFGKSSVKLFHIFDALEIYQKFVCYFLSESVKIMGDCPVLSVNPEWSKGIEKKSVNKKKCKIKSINRYRFIVKNQSVYLALREYETMKLFAEGKTIQCCAEIMGIQHRTCKEYLENIKHKIDVENREQMANSLRGSLYSYI